MIPAGQAGPAAHWNLRVPVATVIVVAADGISVEGTVAELHCGLAVGVEVVHPGGSGVEEQVQRAGSANWLASAL
jgi:FtsP/CotA-like multicopper oxidase with cupredoxin domain